MMCLFVFCLFPRFFLPLPGPHPAVSDGFDNFHPPSTPLSAHPPASYSIHSQQQHHQQQQQQQQQQQLYSNGPAGMLSSRPGPTPQPLHIHPSIPGSPVNAHHHQFHHHHHHNAGPSSAMAALLSGGGPSVPTSVIQAPSTASPISSGGGSPSGGEDNYFSELYNLGGGVGGGYSGQSGLESPHRRKKMKKQRNPDGPDGCPSGKRKNREGNNLDQYLPVSPIDDIYN